VPRALTKLAISRGGSDNVTVMFVDLRPNTSHTLVPAAACAARAEEQEASPVALPAGLPRSLFEDAAGSDSNVSESAVEGEPMELLHTPASAAPAAGSPSSLPPAAAATLAMLAAAAAAEAVPSPFQTSSFQLPALRLAPIKVQQLPREEEAYQQKLPDLRVSSDPCLGTGLAAAARDLCPVMRAHSAPIVGRPVYTVTTGGPLHPSAPLVHPSVPLAAAPAVATICTCGAAARSGSGQQQCAAFCHRHLFATRRALSRNGSGWGALPVAALQAAIEVGGSGAGPRLLHPSQPYLP